MSVYKTYTLENLQKERKIGKMFIVNIEATIFNNGKWLIIERSKKEEHAGGMLSLIGGKVDQEGNTLDILERTVKREIFEEVGVTVKDQLHYVHSTSFVTDKGKHVVDIVFLAEYESGEAFPKSPDEVDEVMWLTYDEIMGNLNSPHFLKESITRAEKLKKKVY
ncbi:NADH pyrophosphatase NudC (nudix superfamily) [Lederbergia wuyishanensis]|uniref:NADH pyrophosphatase NudC (Nudix superfamily) n=2 Tax=Lederbergia wuyishanensis TaxID=1347903 RepID=A0ABU0CYR6_9BACI|nr:NADH pyrophosphatase NudC (nudix superfamily) [Lederbergia wuyishanensis]